ncbi:hypothetical protein EDB81DRAFT_952506 [Dactylonectria macrodidyma]|uniref:CFEM domain-containing protein n=1 Tax=Dactylonectria macrodidyma TaxID=307937 RepID=A0A9P9IG35_9HYPO|nr:hypothetical protein EDB81DRAFT_952506 [Dactylonectria macrodidyma]
MNALLALFVFLFFVCPICCDETLKVPTVPDCARECFEEAKQSSACSTDPQCLCTGESTREHVLTCVKQSCLPEDIFATINATSNACNAPFRDKHLKFDVLAATLTIVASIIVGLRLVERLQCGSGLYADDYLIIFSLAVDIANSAVCIYGLSPNGLGKDAWTVSAEQITAFLRFLFVGSILYTITVFSVKICVLLFYLRIFPGTTIRRLIWATLIANVVCLVIFNIVTLTQCRPISYSWQRWDALHDGECNNINAMAWAGASISIIIDVWMLGLPLSQIVHLQIHWKRKLAVALMLGVGTFVTVVCILRLHALVEYGHTVNPTWDMFSTCYWSIIELNVAIYCVCMPNLRLLLLRLFPRIIGSTHTGSTGVRNMPSTSRAGRIRVNDPADDNTSVYDAQTLHQQFHPKGFSSTTELVEVTRPISDSKATV